MKRRIVAIIMVMFLILCSNPFASVAKASGGTGVFVVYYHSSLDAPASSMTTTVPYGTNTKTYTVAELGFNSNGQGFKGWRIYREKDQTWRYVKQDGSESWCKTLPEGCEYKLYGDGCSVAGTVNAGENVHFYAQWTENTFFVKYHLDESSGAHQTTTVIDKNEGTNILTLNELGFRKDGAVFLGWKAQKERTGQWLILSSSGRIWSDTYTADNIALISDGEWLRDTSGVGETVHLYGVWASSSIDVTGSGFGAVPNDNGDDYAAIQKALNLANTSDTGIIVRIPAGVYYISRDLGIYSDTTLVLDNDTVIKRLNDQYPMLRNGTVLEGETAKGGYERLKNVTICGGTWDGNITNKDSNGCGRYQKSLFFFYHGENLNISGTKLTECCGYHFIEMAAMKGVVINNVEFSDFVPYSGSDVGASYMSEAIQIDFPDAENAAEALPLDGTPCKNITVSGCTFRNVLSGVGNHHICPDGCNGIEILGNTFSNLKGYCVVLAGMQNVRVYDNNGNNVHAFLMVNNCEAVEVYSNTIQHGKNGVTVTLDMVDASSSGLNFHDNTIHGSDRMILENWDGTLSFERNAILYDDVNKNRENALYINNSQIIIAENTITNAGRAAIRLAAGCSGTIRKNTVNTTGEAGIYIADSTVNELTDNTVIGSGSNGMRIENSAVTASGNIIRGSGTNGIYIKNVSPLVLKESEIVGSGTNGIYVSGGNISIVDNYIAAGNEYGIVAYAGANGLTGTVSRNTIVNCGINVPASLEGAGNTVRNEDTFTVKYHETDNGAASSQISTVTYGVSQKTLTVETLGFQQSGKKFKGWKVWRDYDNKWYVKDSSGSKYWATAVPAGGDYALYVNGESVGRTTVAGTTVHFYAQWETDNTFTVKYHQTDTAEASSQISTVTYGVSQKTLTVETLGFQQSGKKFKGWKVWRDYDNKWYVKDSSGSKYWATAVPAGGDYALYVNGESVGRTTVAGTTVHFYAQWEAANTFTVKYHQTDTAAASSQISTVTYGVSQKTLTVETLGFQQSGKKFKGWKVWRDYDNKWYVKDASGSKYWATAVPAGGDYALYVNGESVGRTTVAGTTVHFYAQWETANTFTVKYHQTDTAAASSQISTVTYGVSQKTLTVETLGFQQSGKRFKGWKVWRDYDNKWYVKDPSGSKYWATAVPAGGDYALYVNGESVGRTTVAGTTVHFYAQWEAANTFTVKYHQTDTAEAASQISTVTYGVSQKTLTVETLGFQQSGKRFKGWKVWRDYDNKWYVKDASGSKYWATAVPAGGDYALYVNGESVGKTTVAGTTVHFYAQWETANTFTVKYHQTDTAAASSQISTVTYGVSQKTLTVETLGFQQSGKKFKGWKVWRDYDNKWYVKDSSGSKYWATAVPAGGDYALYVNGESVGKTTVAGTTVHFYAQWESNNAFTVKYYLTDNSSASNQTSTVVYGVSQKTLTIEALGFIQAGKKFKGWKVYRDYDNKWYVKDSTGKSYWATSVPTGGSYALYVNGESVGKTTVAGTTAYFYAQWENTNQFTVKYHLTDTSQASSQTSTVTYGVSQKTLTIETLGFQQSGKRFKGWIVYRDYDNKYYVKDSTGKSYWATEVPAGGSYALYVNGESVGKTTVAGTTAHFYAQWE